MSNRESKSDFCFWWFKVFRWSTKVLEFWSSETEVSVQRFLKLFFLPFWRWIRNGLNMRYKLLEVSPNTMMTGNWKESIKRKEEENTRNTFIDHRISKIKIESSLIKSFYLMVIFFFPSRLTQACKLLSFLDNFWQWEQRLKGKHWLELTQYHVLLAKNFTEFQSRKMELFQSFCTTKPKWEISFKLKLLQEILYLIVPVIDQVLTTTPLFIYLFIYFFQLSCWLQV